MRVFTSETSIGIHNVYFIDEYWGLVFDVEWQPSGSNDWGVLLMDFGEFDANDCVFGDFDANDKQYQKVLWCYPQDISGQKP